MDTHLSNVDCLTTVFDSILLSIENASDESTFEICMDTACRYKTTPVSTDSTSSALEDALHVLAAALVGQANVFVVTSSSASSWRIHSSVPSILQTLHVDPTSVSSFTVHEHRFAHSISFFGTASSVQSALDSLLYVSALNWNSVLTVTLRVNPAISCEIMKMLKLRKPVSRVGKSLLSSYAGLGVR